PALRPIRHYRPAAAERRGRPTPWGGGWAGSSGFRNRYSVVGVPLRAQAPIGSRRSYCRARGFSLLTNIFSPASGGGSEALPWSLGSLLTGQLRSTNSPRLTTIAECV